MYERSVIIRYYISLTRISAPAFSTVWRLSRVSKVSDSLRQVPGRTSGTNM